MANQTNQLRRQFEKLLKRSVVPVLEGIDGYESHWADDAQREFEKVIPDVPDLSQTPMSLRSSMVGAVNMIAIYKMLKAKGLALDEIEPLSESVLKREMARIPKLVLRLSRWFMFTKTAGKMTASAAEKMKDAPANNFRITYEELGDESFQMNVTQCGVCHIARQHECTEFVPVICRVDAMLSDALGWGLKRTQTIAGGGTHCDFVFRKNAETEVSA